MLIEFLQTPHAATDPVERLGDDAVVNAAARLLVGRTEQAVFELLLDLARRPCLTGVIAALASFRGAEAIPRLVTALADDASRPTAERALKRFGRSARSALIETVKAHKPGADRESESSLRSRRSALRLLSEIGVPRKAWPQMRKLMDDGDQTITVLACKVCLVSGSAPEKEAAVRRLVDLSRDVDWMLRDEIEACLRSHPDAVRDDCASSPDYA